MYVMPVLHPYAVLVRAHASMTPGKARRGTARQALMVCARKLQVVFASSWQDAYHIQPGESGESNRKRLFYALNSSPSNSSQRIDSVRCNTHPHGMSSILCHFSTVLDFDESRPFTPCTPLLLPSMSPQGSTAKEKKATLHFVPRPDRLLALSEHALADILTTHHHHLTLTLFLPPPSKRQNGLALHSCLTRCSLFRPFGLVHSILGTSASELRRMGPFFPSWRRQSSQP
ncbi:hypothetical protein V8C26DRAFT_291497 [Trichoderma gracile]